MPFAVLSTWCTLQPRRVTRQSDVLPANAVPGEEPDVVEDSMRSLHVIIRCLSYLCGMMFDDLS